MAEQHHENITLPSYGGSHSPQESRSHSSASVARGPHGEVETHTHSESLTRTADGTRVGTMTDRVRVDFADHSVEHLRQVSHTLGSGENYDRKAFEAAMNGQPQPGYQYKDALSESHTDSFGNTVTRGVGETSGEAAPAHFQASAEGVSGRHAIDARTASQSLAYGHDFSSSTGMAAVHGALANHLQSEGMSASAAQGTASTLSYALQGHLTGRGGHEGASLNFHRDGEGSVSVGERLPAGEGSSISMATLQAVHDQGMPRTGVSALRTHLGAELAGKSDLQVVDTFGHDVTHAVGEQGFPTQAVQERQSAQGGSQTEALQQLGQEARSHAEAPQASSASVEMSH